MASANSVNPDSAVTQRTILFAGGGSGGHLYPALTVARLLLQRQECDTVVFLTSTRSIDAQIMSAAVKETPAIRWIPVASVPKGNLVQRSLAVPASLLKTRRATLEVLNDFRPLLCVGIGAFASVAASLVCARQGIPLVLMEQNVVPGRATCFLSRYAQLVLAGLPIAGTCLNRIRCPVITTGVPVRPEIASLASRHLGQSDERPGQRHLLILGGSQGARSLNDLAAQAVLTPGVLPEQWRVMHQAGESDVQRMRTKYSAHHQSHHITVCAFLEDMASAIQTADLVISRSGAGILAELACSGTASILVPHPSSSGEHQRLNAEHFATAGAARVVLQNDVDAEQQLSDVICRLTQQPDQRHAMAIAGKTLANPSAAHDAVNALVNIIGRSNATPQFK